MSLRFGLSWSRGISDRLLWTQLLGGIHHVRWGHLQTLGLPPELLQLPPPAVQEVDPLPRFHVHQHLHAVPTGCADEDSPQVALMRPIVGEATAFHRDVEGVILAWVVETNGPRVRHTRLAALAWEALSLFLNRSR